VYERQRKRITSRYYLLFLPPSPAFSLCPPVLQYPPLWPSATRMATAVIYVISSHIYHKANNQEDIRSVVER
jgi:hypothetical protein